MFRAFFLIVSCMFVSLFSLIASSRINPITDNTIDTNGKSAPSSLNRTSTLEWPCIEGSSFKIDCNYCMCSGGLVLCTLMACSEDNTIDTNGNSAPSALDRTSTLEPPCIEGSSFKKDCNYCVCSRGLAFCTLMYCFKDICKQPIETGRCFAAIRRFAFNSQNGRCEEFTYGGCEGNDNNFLTIEDCKNTCKDESAVVDFAAEAELEHRNICHLPTVTGPCRAYFPRFSFNPRVNRCGPFIYGGCCGNENNFANFDACFERCGGDPNICRQPIIRGPCHLYIRRFAFNSRLGRCVEFTYGGCQGNNNNFLTERECENACLVQVFASEEEQEHTDVCSLPPEVGPCKVYVPRFYFNPQNDLCVPFVYGGCEGNANKFETFDACSNKCGGGPEPGQSASTICNLPVEKGPCKAIIPRYTFMTETEKCEKFEYGGCEGNANNFLTLEDCNRVCKEEA